jgi:hypothetical protein
MTSTVILKRGKNNGIADMFLEDHFEGDVSQN